MGSPIKTWSDLVAEAKKRPLKVAVTGFGTPDDITVNYFTKKGINLSVGAVRQAGRALHGDSRRARRPAVRAGWAT